MRLSEWNYDPVYLENYSKPDELVGITRILDQLGTASAAPRPSAPRCTHSPTSPPQDERKAPMQTFFPAARRTCAILRFHDILDIGQVDSKRGAEREFWVVHQIVADFDLKHLTQARSHVAPEPFSSPTDFYKVTFPDAHLCRSCVHRGGISAGNSPSSVRCRRRLRWRCRDSAVHPHHTSAAASGSFTNSNGSAIHTHVRLSTMLIVI